VLRGSRRLATLINFFIFILSAVVHSYSPPLLSTKNLENKRNPSALSAVYLPFVTVLQDYITTLGNTQHLAALNATLKLKRFFLLSPLTLFYWYRLLPVRENNRLLILNM